MIRSNLGLLRAKLFAVICGWCFAVAQTQHNEYFAVPAAQNVQPHANPATGDQSFSAPEVPVHLDRHNQLIDLAEAAATISAKDLDEYHPYTAFHATIACPEGYAEVGVFCGTGHGGSKTAWPTAKFYVHYRPPSLRSRRPMSDTPSNFASPSTKRGRRRSGHMAQLKCPQGRFCRTHGGPNRTGFPSQGLDRSQRPSIDCVLRSEIDWKPIRAYNADHQSRYRLKKMVAQNAARDAALQTMLEDRNPVIVEAIAEAVPSRSTAGRAHAHDALSVVGPDLPGTILMDAGTQPDIIAAEDDSLVDTPATVESTAEYRNWNFGFAPARDDSASTSAYVGLHMNSIP